MKILKLLFLIIALNLYSSRANATLNITIKDENLSKTKILFIGFEANNFSLDNEAKQILQKIIYNLKTTNLVEPLAQNSISQISISPQINETNSSTAGNINQNTLQPTDFIDINAIPDFDKYYNSGIEGLVMAQFSYDAIGNLETRVRMWDVLDRKQTFGKFYSSTPENYRKTANLLSD